MPDKLDLFYKVLKENDGDDQILDAVQEQYQGEINTVERKAEDIGEMVLKKIIPDKEKPESVPTLTTERIEDNVRRTTPDATATAMRPSFPVIKQTSRFFKDLKYDVSLDGVEATHRLGNCMSLSSNLDVFDKMVGFNFEREYNSQVRFKTGVEYEPFHNSGKLKASYSTRDLNVYGNVYLNKDNPGINAGYSRRINFNSSFSTSVGIFKEDAAIYANYNKQFQDKSQLSVGAYGSTKYKEIGLTARLGF